MLNGAEFILSIIEQESVGEGPGFGMDENSNIVISIGPYQRRFSLCASQHFINLGL